MRKLYLAGRSLVPILWSKALIYSPHFYLNKVYKGSRTEAKYQINLLPNHSAKTTKSPTTERPQHLSVVSIFQPPVFLDFFSIEPPPFPVHLHWVVFHCSP